MQARRSSAFWRNTPGAGREKPISGTLRGNAGRRRCCRRSLSPDRCRNASSVCWYSRQSCFRSSSTGKSMARSPGSSAVSAIPSSSAFATARASFFSSIRKYKILRSASWVCCSLWRSCTFARCRARTSSSSRLFHSASGSSVVRAFPRLRRSFARRSSSSGRSRRSWAIVSICSNSPTMEPQYPAAAPPNAPQPPRPRVPAPGARCAPSPASPKTW